MHWFLGLYFTEASKTGRSEISAVRGNQGSAQTQLTPSTKQEKLTLLHRLASPLKWTASSSETVHYWQ